DTLFKVDGSPWELWRSMGMGMEEEYSPKRGMGTGMVNILDCGAMSGKVPSVQSPLR
ncbi:hypothetical protein A2U01_0070768, partial [Trifolium medium]|nr:hypothetical protein [Trifolium medium]